MITSLLTFNYNFLCFEKQSIDLIFSGDAQITIDVECIEAFLKDNQRSVSGIVRVVLSPGRVDAVAVKSDNILASNEGVYAQSASWTEAESKGFIKLIGQSSATWSSLHKNK